MCFKNRPIEFAHGIDVLGTIRSFDACMPCTMHMDTGTGTGTGTGVMVREVNSCGCTLE
jgi:hydrogenase large subunit